MNAAWLGKWYAGPRAHPNDGLIDITVGALAWGQRLKARTRLPTGTHLPHPALDTPRVDTWVHRFDRPTEVWLDGIRAGRHDSLKIEVIPDAVSVLI